MKPIRREQLARMELDLGDDPAGLRPALRPVMEAGVDAHDMVRRSAGAALRQPIDPFVQLRIALDADGVIPALGLQQVEERRDGEGRIGPEPPPGDRGSGLGRVSRQHRLQHFLPAVGAVDIAGTQGAPLQIAELVEHEERMQALRLEMTIPRRSLLIAMHRAFRAVHVQSDDLRRSLVVYRVDPTARQFDQRPEVLGPGQHLGLEPTHGTGRGRAVLDCAAADKLAHHRIAAEPVGVVDVLVAGEPREDRLAQQPGETMSPVPARARIGDEVRRHVRQAEGVVQLPMQQKAAVGTDRGASEREFHRAVEPKPERVGSGFTRCVRRQMPAPLRLTH